jgi:hypothetical protein
LSTPLPSGCRDLFLDDSCRIAYGDDLRPDWPDDYGTGAYGAAVSNWSHYDGRGPNPAIRTNINPLKFPFGRSGDLPLGIPTVLSPPAQNLNLRRNLCPIAYRTATQYAVRSDINALS